MDPLTSGLISAAPQFGVGGLLLGLVVYLLRNASSERSDYRAGMAAARESHAAELDRVRRVHDAERSELHENIRNLRARVTELNSLLDSERSARHAAEDRAAEALRRAGGASS